MESKKERRQSRRDFLKTSSFSLLSFSIPQVTLDFFPSPEKLKIGLISDLHVDIIHDGALRLDTFLKKAKTEKPHALIQMGDFAIPKPENQFIIQSFNSANEHAYHVLGNHDMDGGYSREEVTKTYGMAGLYYPADLESIRLLVLDGNDPGSPKYKGGYASYIGQEQQAWLRSELEKADKPVLIVSHQPIAGIYTIDNAQEIQQLLSTFSSKILLAINGHAHVNQHLEVGGVNYVHINSASYYWVGEKLSHNSLPDTIHAKFPSLQYTCPYSEALFAFLTIDPDKKRISIEGKRAKWLGPSPQELGYSILNAQEQRDNLQPEIGNFKIG